MTKKKKNIYYEKTKKCNPKDSHSLINFIADCYSAITVFSVIEGIFSELNTPIFILLKIKIKKSKPPDCTGIKKRKRKIVSSPICMG